MRRRHALVALMSIYGIELHTDTVFECRANLIKGPGQRVAGSLGERLAKPRVIRVM